MSKRAMPATAMHALASGVLTFCIAGGVASAAAQTYAPTFGGDVMQRYVREGTLVEVEGWIWLNKLGVFYNVAQQSARASLPLNTDDLSPESRQMLATRCAAEHQFSGGCKAIVRGKVIATDGRPGLRAHVISVGE